MGLRRDEMGSRVVREGWFGGADSEALKEGKIDRVATSA